MNPYRIIVTNGGGRYLVLSLVRLVPEAADRNPTRVQHPFVERVLRAVKVCKPRRVPSGVCMPPEPQGDPANIYELELQRLYADYRQLVEATERVE